MKCVAVFPTLEALQRHIREAHPSTPEVTCPMCGATFSTQEKLRVHKIETH